MELINRAKVHRGEIGFLARVSGAEYLKMAYVQALSIKLTQRTHNKYAIIVDTETAKLIEPKHREVIDEVIVDPIDWDFTREWSTFNLTPWKKTVKLDVDVLMVDDVSRQLSNAFAYPMLFTSTIFDFRGAHIRSRKHRRVFDNNLLPDIYTAFYTFKDHAITARFFEIAQAIGNDWEWVATEFLKNNFDQRPKDDEIFALTASVLFDHQFLEPGSLLTLTHLKPEINGLSEHLKWYEQLPYELNNENETWVGGHRIKYGPLHYADPGFITDEIVTLYERNYRKFLEGIERL